MRIVALYHPHSDHARKIEEYVREFERRHAQTIELVSLETRDGTDMARVYDITRYPALLALQETGEMLQLWQDEYLPLMDEVMSYAQSSRALD